MYFSSNIYMKYNSSKLWGNFIKLFEENLIKLNKKKPLSERLYDPTEMTIFYKQELFKEIAQGLDLKISPKEYLRIDIMLYKEDKYLYPVPIIFIETENNANGDLDNEICKLLSVNAPLKILMTRLSKEELKKVFDKHEDTYWYYPLQDFAKLNRLMGYFGVISAVWDENNNLAYYYIAYNENGTPLCNIRKINIE